MNSVSAIVTTSDNLKAMQWAVVYAALIAGMHVCIRLVSEGLHPFEIVFFRNIFPGKLVRVFVEPFFETCVRFLFFIAFCFFFIFLF